jgi:hypothetical protein
MDPQISLRCRFGRTSLWSRAAYGTMTVTSFDGALAPAALVEITRTK